MKLARPRLCFGRIALWKARQNWRLLDADCLKGSGIDAQALQDCWRHLRGGHRRLHDMCSQSWIRDNQADTGVTETESAVLGVLLPGTGVDCSVLRLNDQVGDTAVVEGLLNLSFSSSPAITSSMKSAGALAFK